jgi:hypothetical protein
MAERRDPELTDEALEGEIELVGELVVAASEQDGPMSESDIDRILGIVTPDGHDHDGAGADEPAGAGAPDHDGAAGHEPAGAGAPDHDGAAGHGPEAAPHPPAPGR